MAKIEGIKEWSEVILLEDGDVLKGGADGLANVQAKALVDRTEYLKEELLEVKEQTAGLGPSVGGGGEGSGGGMPAGTIVAFGGTKVPTGFLECNGAVLSRTTFAGLFAAIGVVWGEPSSTTFRIPNFTEAERFLRSRSETLAVGTFQGDAIRNITGSMSGFASTSAKPTSTGVLNLGNLGSAERAIGNSATWTRDVMIDTSISLPTATENRPKSAVVMYCIKAYDSVVDPEQILAHEVLATVAYRSELQELVGTRFWTSEELLPVANTITYSTHPLGYIVPEKTKFDVVLTCKIADQGFVPGDLLSNFVTTISTGNNAPVQLRLKNYGFSIYTGAALLARNAGNSALGTLTPANWRYVFRIWY